MLLFIVLKYSQLRMNRKVELFRAAIATEERERKRIASDLHDGFSARLSALKLELENHLAIEGAAFHPAVIQLKTIIQDLREFSRSITSTTVERLGLIRALQEIQGIVNKSNRFELSLAIEPLPFLTPYAATTIYFITQELIANSLRHARGNEITLEIYVAKKQLILEYDDNGQNPEPIPTPTTGIGLQNIEARVSQLKGTMVPPADFKHGAHYRFAFPLEVLSSITPLTTTES